MSLISSLVCRNKNNNIQRHESMQYRSKYNSYLHVCSKVKIIAQVLFTFPCDIVSLIHPLNFFIPSLSHEAPRVQTILKQNHGSISSDTLAALSGGIPFSP